MNIWSWLKKLFVKKEKAKPVKACCIDNSGPCECGNGDTCRFDLCVKDNSEARQELD